MSDFDFEPVRGLPENLPAGERLLWQGAPDWHVLARRSLHVRKVAVWFAILLAWSLAQSWQDERSLAYAGIAALWVAGLGLVAMGILYAIAFAIARTTVYSITSRRVVMRVGVALPITINLPFARIRSAALKTDAGGFGNIPMVLGKDDRVAYFALWPHARAWRINNPEPMLLALPQAVQVAQILADALSGLPVRPARNLSEAGGSVETASSRGLTPAMFGGELP